MLTNKSEILERWNQYFKKLLDGKEETDEANNPTEVSGEEYQDSQEGTQLPTADELEEATDKPNNTAPGSESIKAKLIKSSKCVLINILHKIIHEVWESGRGGRTYLSHTQKR
jgi:hypothetical protein